MVELSDAELIAKVSGKRHTFATCLFLRDKFTHNDMSSNPKAYINLGDYVSDYINAPTRPHGMTIEKCPNFSKEYSATQVYNMVSKVICPISHSQKFKTFRQIVDDRLSNHAKIGRSVGDILHNYQVAINQNTMSEDDLESILNRDITGLDQLFSSIWIMGEYGELKKGQFAILPHYQSRMKGSFKFELPLSTAVLWLTYTYYMGLLTARKFLRNDDKSSVFLRTVPPLQPVPLVEEKPTINKYQKDVSHLDCIDIYDICEIYQVNDPSGAIHHAIKKLLMAGNRGHKDALTDLKEAAQAINRKIESMTNDKGSNDNG